MVFSIGSIRPEEMMIRAAPVWVLPAPLILFQSIDRRGIRIAVVEVPDFLCDIKERREWLCSLAHGKFSIQKIPARRLLSGKSVYQPYRKGEVMWLPLRQDMG